jgi:tRNA-specific 2-thiouridylase
MAEKDLKKPKASPERSRRVLLGMSGGVDSSVSAVLLLEQGYEVIGAFMKNWSERSSKLEDRISVEETPNSKFQIPNSNVKECSWRTERRDAMRVAAQLDIPFYTFDFEDLYRKDVYEYMIAEYESGRTPNPDVLCNKYMKFGYLLEKAEELGCDYIATGHYARKTVDENGVSHLLAGVDGNKDQTYFLCQLKQEQLSKALFPIGELEKPRVREIAREHKLVVCDKKDSQGICFVGKVNMMEFLKERIPEEEGNIVTTAGEVIGTHKGHAYYTIGQRTGLGIGGGVPYFVVERRPETNELIVAVGEDDPALLSSSLEASDISETIEGSLDQYTGKKLKARIRYRQPLQECRISKIEDGVVYVDFNEEQRAVAPGQFIAFYDGEELVGSAVIDSAK